MRYKPTILNIASAVFIIWIIVDSTINYNVLASGEGWGMVASFGLLGIGILAAIIDLTLQSFIKKQFTVNAIGLIIAIGLTIAILSDF